MRRENGNYLASFCDEKGVAGQPAAISFLDAEDKIVSSPIPKGDAIYGILKLPTNLEKVKLVKLR